MNTTIETVTPEIARQWMTRNSKNRPLRQIAVRKLAYEMKYGGWKDDGAPIRFSESGELLDGQHRLAAIILAKHTARFVVVRGLDEEAFTTMDSGIPRRVHDVLAIAGVASATCVSSAAKAMLAIRNNTPVQEVKASHSVILEAVRQNPEIIDATRELKRIGKLFPAIRCSSIAAVIMQTRREDIEKSEEFWEKVSKGEMLANDCPCLQLRKRMIGLSGMRRDSDERIRLTLKAWYLFKSGKKCSLLR